MVPRSRRETLLNGLGILPRDLFLVTSVYSTARLLEDNVLRSCKAMEYSPDVRESLRALVFLWYPFFKDLHRIGHAETCNNIGFSFDACLPRGLGSILLVQPSLPSWN